MRAPVHPVLIVGLGNPLMGDDGIGVRVLGALRARRDLPPDTELIDMGTGGLALLHVLPGRRRVVVVDAADMELRPGESRVFTPAEAASRRGVLRFSTHEGDPMRILELAGRRPFPPEEVLWVGVQPLRVGPGLELSPALEARLSDYADTVLDAAREEPACTSSP